MGKKVTIIGGHGHVSLRLARLLSPAHSVTSIIRNPEQIEDIKSTGATPLLLSVEDSPLSDFVTAFEGQDVLYFCAGAGSRAEEERTKKVDYEGAIKVFDAIERVESQVKPRLISISAVDIRNPEKIPEHYNEADLEHSRRFRSRMAGYVKWKYEADKNLSKRTAFKWTILRATLLSDEPSTGKASIGRTHMDPPISRDTVAQVFSLLVDREDAAGLGIDLVGGETPVEKGLDAFIKKGVSDFLG